LATQMNKEYDKLKLQAADLNPSGKIKTVDDLAGVV
jgi:hypothetical protein